MKRTILAFTLFGAGLVALPSGCSSSSSDGGSSGGDAGTSDKDSGVEVSGDADAACTALASAICERTSTCTPFALNAIYGDSATCQSREKASCVADAQCAFDRCDRELRANLRDLISKPFVLRVRGRHVRRVLRNQSGNRRRGRRMR